MLSRFYHNDRGYTLIYVLLMVTIVFILVIPMISKVLMGSREITTEVNRDTNNYTAESVMEITKGFVEANSINENAMFKELITNLNAYYRHKNINIQLDEGLNKVTITAKNNNDTKRDDSKLIFTYKTFHNLFESNSFVMQSGSKCSNSIKILISNAATDCTGFIKNIDSIGDAFVFNQIMDYKLYWYSSSFPKARENPDNSFMSYVDMDDLIQYLDQVPDQEFRNILANYQDKNLYIDEYIIFGVKPGFNDIKFKSLWIAGNRNANKGNQIIGPSRQSGTLTINGSLYSNGSLAISNFNKVHIKGDLVTYGKDPKLSISNVNEVIVDGSIISNGNMEINIYTGKDIERNMNLQAKYVISKNGMDLKANGIQLEELKLFYVNEKNKKKIIIESDK
ncbi:hypothetical protein [Bacillus tuaregi]|uniref:hypothetical protein n=1 Tax=Bacillus tuaregi TaxID=1816695 RepID=UPI0008F922EE|nr:hypothetical protein [Bacillus tuaregi]